MVNTSKQRHDPLSLHHHEYHNTSSSNRLGVLVSATTLGILLFGSISVYGFQHTSCNSPKILCASSKTSCNIQQRPMLTGTTSTTRARAACNALSIHSVFHIGTQRLSLPAAPRSRRHNFVNHHPLFSSASSDNNNNQKNNGKRQRAVVLLSKIKLSLIGIMRRLTSTKSRITTNFGRLSKKAKLIVLGYVMVVGLLLGFMGKTAYEKRTSPDFPINKRPIEITYSSFMDLVETQSSKSTAITTSGPLSSSSTPRMDRVRIAPDRISFRLSTLSSSSSSENDEKVKYLSAYTRKPDASPETLQYLRTHNVDFTAAASSKNVILIYTLRSAMLTLYVLFLWRMYQTMKGATTGNSQHDVPGKLLSRDGDANRPLASFQDVQGIDDAKQEVMELVDTLRNPEKYAILGARAPTGLLLEGPPGTGKTMLARATAATAGVPLLYCSGSDFIELYVGRGAGRVRRMFERAQKLSPCIIFIDELDTLGKARDSGNGMFGMASSRANDEAEQTLNQLLSCMDGLDSSRRICVLAATNRKDVLDPALVRPGRFDRIVTLKLPNANGRENILRVHAQKLPGFQECSGCDPDRKYSLGKGNKVDLSAVAAVTDGLSGAELEFIVNEAAIRAVRRVSAALRGGVDPETITEPHVTARDFEASVANFFETRRKNSGSAADVWKNVFKS